jgi:hypothetical protein
VFVASYLERGGRKVQPPKLSKAIMKRYVLFPSKAMDYGTDEELESEMRAFLDRYVDVPGFWAKLMVAYAKMTWVYTRFNVRVR